MLDILSAVFGFVVSNKYYLLSAFTLLVMVRAILFRGVFDPKKYPDSFAEYKEAIRTEKWGEQYLSWLRKLSNWLTNLIGDYHRFPEKAPPKQPFWQYLKNNNPWTVESYEFCLRLAYIYPLIAFAVAWGIGGNGVLGSQEIYQVDLLWYERLFYLLVLCSVAVLLWFGRMRVDGWKRLLTIGVALLVILSASYFVASGLFMILVALFAGVIASFSAPIIVLVSTVTAVYLLVMGVAVILGMSDLLFLSFFGGVILFIGIPRILSFFYVRSMADSSVGGFWLVFNVAILLFSLIGLTVVVNDALAYAFALLFVLLPLINAVMDWLSLGVTRHLLQRLQVDHGWSHAILWAAIDLVLALVFLFLISMVLVGIVSVANVFAVNSVLDLKAVFASLRDTSDHRSDFWVYFLLLSTLIPTLIHFSLVGGALTRLVPASWRQRMVDGIGKHEHRTWEAYAYLVFTPAVGFVLAPTLLLSLLWWIASTHGGVIGFGLLDMAEWLALWIDPTLGHES